MRTVYDLLRVRCGLSQEEAAAFHGVRLDTVKSWCAGRNQANERILKELRGLYQLIVHASGQLGARIDALKGGSASAPPRGSGADESKNEISLGMPASDAAAQRLGFPSMGAHAAAIALALAGLTSGVAVQLVPMKPGMETAIASTQKTAGR